MKRHPSLHPLSEHHHHALVQALLIRGAAAESRRRRPAAVRRVARDYLRFWHATGRLHFREEEEVLLPALARRVSLEDEPAVLKMLAQHADIRARIAALAATLAAGGNVEPELTALGQRLHDHVRLEESQVFPRLEAVLSEKELRVLARRLTRLHGPPRRARRRKARTNAARKR